MSEDLKADLIEVIAKILSVDNRDILPEAHLKDDFGADSLDFIELKQGIEELIKKRTHTEIELELLLNATVGDIFKTINRSL